MQTKNKFILSSKRHSFIVVSATTVALLFGALATSAQTNKYDYSGSEQTITLNPGTYDITAYGAQGGYNAGIGAQMEGQFSFGTTVNLKLLVGGSGGRYYENGGSGGGGGTFVVQGSTPLVVAGGGGGGYLTFDYGGPGNVGTQGGSGNGGDGGSDGFGGGTFPVLPEESGGGGGGGGYTGDGTNAPNGGGGGGKSFLDGGSGGSGMGLAGTGAGGFGGGAGGAAEGGGGGGGYSGGGGGFQNAGGGGGSYIDSSAIAIITEAFSVASPDDPPNGEIIITAVQPTLAISQSGNTVTIYWQNVPGWSLQQNTNFASPTGWVPSSGIATSNGTNYWTITAPTGNLFFRLSN